MKFTIGIPITKVGYLKESLESITNQTFKDFEIVIKNNAATPELKAEVKEMCNTYLQHDHINYFESKEQLPMTQNFNTIIDQAKGDYFVIMSDDDIMEADFLKEFDSLIEKYPEINVHHCRVMRVDGEDQLIDFSETCPEWESQIDFIYHRMTSRRALYLSDFVSKTSELKNIGGFPIESSGWGCDEVTWMRLANRGVGYTSKVLLRYRRFLGNFSLSKENLLRRFKDVKFIHGVTEELIENYYKANKPVYPYQYMKDLNAIKAQKQNDYILEHYANSSNVFGTLVFYKENKEQFSFKGLVKSLAIKTFFKRKTYPIA